MAVPAAHSLHVGSLDLLDLVLRIRLYKGQSTLDKWTLLNHEFFHYAQVVCTPAGLGHLINLDKLLSHTSALAKKIPDDFQPPLIALTETFANTDSNLFIVKRALSEMVSVWHFVDRYPSLPGPIVIDRDFPITLDSSLGQVCFGEAISLKIGLHAICEQMSRAAEYTIRQQVVMNRIGLEAFNKAMEELRDLGSLDENVYNARLTSMGIDMDGLKSEVIPKSFPVSALLYDLPLLLSKQRGWKPGNVGVLYSLLCGWIVLMASRWIPSDENPEVPVDIGNQYLRMIEDGADIAHDLYDQETKGSSSRFDDSFNGIRMADAICQQFGMQSFTACLEKHEATLSAIVDRTRPANREERPPSALYWYASDGLKILHHLRETPQFLFCPFVGYDKGGKHRQMPLPPIFYKDMWVEANPDGFQRTMHHVGSAVLKELLLCDHKITRTSSGATASTTDGCHYGDACIFRPLPDHAADHTLLLRSALSGLVNEAPA